MKNIEEHFMEAKPTGGHPVSMLYLLIRPNT